MTVVGVRSQGSVAKNGALFFFLKERKNAALPGGMADETAGGNAHPDARTANIACVCLA